MTAPNSPNVPFPNEGSKVQRGLSAAMAAAAFSGQNLGSPCPGQMTVGASTNAPARPIRGQGPAQGDQGSDVARKLW